MIVNLEVYDTNFEKILVLDSFSSFIWTERYNDTGDFELAVNPESVAFSRICSDYYVSLIRDTDLDKNERKMMIVEDVKLSYSAEAGYVGIISGRSLESLLDRRILWNLTWYAGNLQDGIKLLLDDNIIKPIDSKRRIDNFEFIESDNKDIQNIGIEIQEVGKTVLETIKDICQANNVGFEVVINLDTCHFLFKLYKGENRSLDNPKDNLVIEFSEKNENLLNSNFVNSSSAFKNTILVSGEGEDDKKYFTTYNNTNFGINRKEMYLESNLSYNLDDYEKISIPEYERLLKDQGKNELKKLEKTTSFEGEVSASHENDLFIYGEDFFIGDVVYVYNKYGIESSVIISEIVESYDENGRICLPTFEYIEQKPTEIKGTIYIDSTNKTFEIKNIPIDKPITIDWGDGTIETGVSGDISHTYTGKEAVYIKTYDTEIVSGKTYYTRSGSEGSYVYTKVENPVVSELQNYYEMQSPSEYEGLYDFKFHRTDNYDIDFCPKFTNSKVLYTIIVPNGIKELEEKTFYDCTLLSSAILPNSLEKINGEQMFYNCSNLFSMALPNSISTLQSNTFQNCSNLIECNIPYNSKNVPSYFFNNCAKLKSVSFLGNTYSKIGIETISSKAINSCPKVKDVVFGSMVKDIYGDFLTGPSEEINMKSLNITPPNLRSSFSVQVGEIEVPNSPKFDNTVLNAYKTKWPSYSSKFKEKDGKPQENKNDDKSYAKNSKSSGGSSGGRKKTSFAASSKEQLDIIISNSPDDFTSSPNEL